MADTLGRNRGDLKTEIAANLIQTGLDTRIYGWMADCLKRLSTRHIFYDACQYTETPTLASGQETYDLISNWSLNDVQGIYSIRLKPASGDIIKVDPVTAREVDRDNAKHDDAETGTPARFFLWVDDLGDRKLTFQPTPSASWTVYMRWVKWLGWNDGSGTAETGDSIDGASYPDLTRADDAIIAWCTARGFLHLKEWNAFDRWMGWAEKAILERIETDETPLLGWEKVWRLDRPMRAMDMSKTWADYKTPEEK